jgi:hypothetical protein
MKNQVIKVLNKEHGKKVIKYWKNIGVDVKDYLGQYTEEDCNTFIYYGIIDGMFKNYSYKQVLNRNAEIIELHNEFKRGQRVLVRDGDDSEWYESIFITKIYGSVYPYVVVASDYKDNFINGKEFVTSEYKQCKKLQSKKLTPQEFADKIKKDLEFLKSKVDNYFNLK